MRASIKDRSIENIFITATMKLPAHELLTCMMVLTLSGVSRTAAAERDTEIARVKKVAAELFEAYSAGDTEKMKSFFAAKVKYHGDPKLIDGDATKREAIELTRDQLADAYSKFFKKVGKDRWTALIKRCKPTLERAASDGKPVELAKSGDYVYDLHFREATKGKRRDLDEAFIFVFRHVDGEYRVVAHYADP